MVSEMNGIEDGKIIVDAYSGEAMNPDYAWIWRDFCAARADLELVARRLEEDAGIEWVAPDVDDDAPFLWRDLTPEEETWCLQQYAERSPWSQR